MAALQLKELLAAQQRLKQKEEQEAQQPESISVADLQKILSGEADKENQEEQSKVTDDVKKAIQETAENTKDTPESAKTLKKGLVEKTGDGLNANVIKLTEVLKKQAKGVVTPAVSPVAAVANIAEQRGATLDQRSREQAARYVPGTKDFIRDNIGFKYDGGGLKGLGKSLKGMFSLENMLDMSEGKNMGGLLGGELRNKVQKKQYVKDRMATESNRYLNMFYEKEKDEKGEVKKDKSGKPIYKLDEKGNKVISKENQKKIESTFNRQYDEQRATRGLMNRNEKEIDRMRGEGFADSDLARAGMMTKRERLDKDLQVSDPQYRALRAVDDEAATGEKQLRKPRAVKKAAFVAELPEGTALEPVKPKRGRPKKAAAAVVEEVEATPVKKTRSKKAANLENAAPADIPAPIATLARATAAAPASQTLIPPPTTKEASEEAADAAHDQLEAVKRIGDELVKHTDLLTKIASSAGTGAATAATAQAQPQEEGGSLIDTALDMVGNGKGSKGKGILNTAKNVLGKGKGVLSKGGGLLKSGGGLLKAGGGLLKGGLGAIGGMALSYGGEKLKESGHEKLGGAADVAGKAASWAGTGAMIGSVIPGVGTAVGGAIGGVAGAAKGLYDNWGNLFGSDKDKAKPVAAAPIAAAPAVAPPAAGGTGAGAGPMTSVTNGILVANEPVVPGKPLSPQQMKMTEMSMRMGNKLDPTVQQAYDLAKAAPPSDAQQVYQKSSDNAAASAAPPFVAPITVNAPTTNNTSPQTTVMPTSSKSRNTESSLQQYNRARYAF